MQGRLVGKRVQAEAFLAGVIDHGAHFCTYLLGTDMEMGTPEGFALMNWETGYGDWIAEPAWDTLRVAAVAREDGHRARRRHRRGAATRSRSARGRSSSARSTGPRTMGIAVKCGSELEYYVLKDSWESLAERGWPVPKAFGYYNEDYQLLQATKAEPLHRLLRNQMTAGRGSRSSSARARRPTASTRSTSATTTCSSRPTGPCSSSTAPRRSPTSTAGASRSWPSPTTAGPARRATST